MCQYPQPSHRVSDPEQALPTAGRLAFNKLRDIPEPEDEDQWQDMGAAGLNDLEDALNGDGEGLMESAGGGEFRDTLEDVMRRERERERERERKRRLAISLRFLEMLSTYLRQYPDRRKRRRRVALQANGFEGQIDAMTDSYIEWGAKVKGSFDKDVAAAKLQEVQKHFFIIVVDVFRAYESHTSCDTTNVRF